MKGFGFPSNGTGVTYKADTSKQKKELINVLTQSERLWQEDGKAEQSLVQLRKGINLIKYIISNETIQSVKQTYVDKQKELEKRLQDRDQNKQTVKTCSGGGGGGYQKGEKNQSNQLKGQISQAIVTQKPNVKWQDVSGLQNAKNSLKQAVILPINFPQIFIGSRKPWKGILLYGPPGTGKTFLAKACATQAQGTFFSVSSSDLMSKYVGESQKLIKSLFALARQKKPSIIFIDEIDSMCGSRSDADNDASRRVKTEFLVQMQGVGKDDMNLLVLGATNLPWALDSAIRRRFQRRIYIPLPEYEARLGMLKRGMRDNPSTLNDVDFDQLAKKTQGFSGSDISILIRDSVFEPVRRLQTATRFKKINGKFVPCRPDENGQEGKWTEFKKNEIEIDVVSRRDFDEALKRTKPSVDQKQLKEYEQFTASFGQDG